MTEQAAYLAYNPGVRPKQGGLPGLGVLKDVVGSINLFGIIAVVGALAIAALVWAWGHHTGGPQAEQSGKKGTMVAAGCALLLGAANGIVAFFSAMGAKVQ